MADFDPTPPSFAGVKYDIGTVPNIGEGYAKGITAAGESISKGVSSALDVMNRRQNATDMLNAMHAGGMLNDKAYSSVAGKSLGAQEQMLGMYANQWILDQAQQRQLQQIGYQGATNVAQEHAKLLDTVNAVRSGYGTAAGVNARNLLANPPGQQPPPGQAPVQTAPLVGPGGPMTTPGTPQQAQAAQQVAGTPGAPTPLGSSGNIYQPFQVGSAAKRTDVVPPGSTMVKGTGPKGETQFFIKHPNGMLQPIQG